MTSAVSKELYLEYKDRVLHMTTARQTMQGQQMVGVFSDRQIAASLGLSEEQVREIRCLAEMDAIDINWFPEAEAFKQARAGRGKRPKEA